MPKTITVGVLTNETGAHLGAYFPALATSPETGRVVLGDPSGQSEAGAGRGLGKKLAKVYRSHEELLKVEKPAMVLVSLESRRAPGVIRKALEAGCHVFAEKPACVRAGDFAELVDLADRKHLHLMLALANRTNPETQVARKLIAGGQIGKVYGVELHIIADQTRLTSPSYQKRWYAKKDRAGGGHLAWLGIHWLDLATYLTGTHVTHVTGFTANVGGQPLDVEDSAAVALKYANGTLGTLTSGYYLDRGYHTHIKIWGAKGWVHLDSQGEKPLTWQSWKAGAPQGIQIHDGPKTPRGYTPFVHAAVRAAAGLAPPPVTSADGLRVLKTVFGLYQAHASGRTQVIG
ncbi:MAG: Gfo/Idh/MocA family oxidoreductase [Planctomycetaceae bacterium]